MVYVDTSALVALVANEPTAAALSRWLAGQADEPLCSADWCVPEVAGALAIKVRTGQFDSALADEAWEAFGAVCDEELTLVPMQAADFATAAQMCRIPQANLRAGDALHLAVALRQGCDGFLALDASLNVNAQASGLKLVSP